MSNLSEEEIILEFIKQEYGNYDNYVRDLLDLYNKEKEYAMGLYYDNQGLGQDLDKEKEKNKELDKENTRQHELLSKIHKKYQEDYISKDKIKDTVEYIRYTVDDDNKSSEIVKEVNKYLDYFLEELLKGE